MSWNNGGNNPNPGPWGNPGGRPPGGRPGGPWGGGGQGGGPLPDLDELIARLQSQARRFVPGGGRFGGGRGLALLGLVGEQSLVTDSVEYLRDAGAPPETVDTVEKSLTGLVESSGGKLGFGLVVGLLLGINGASGVFGAAGRALLPHGQERANAAFITRAPRFDPLAQPRFLGRQPLVEFRLLCRLAGKRRFLVANKRCVVARP